MNANMHACIHPYVLKIFSRLIYSAVIHRRASAKEVKNEKQLETFTSLLLTKRAKKKNANWQNNSSIFAVASKWNGKKERKNNKQTRKKCINGMHPSHSFYNSFINLCVCTLFSLFSSLFFPLCFLHSFIDVFFTVVLLSLFIRAFSAREPFLFFLYLYILSFFTPSTPFYSHLTVTTIKNRRKNAFEPISFCFNSFAIFFFHTHSLF